MHKLGVDCQEIASAFTHDGEDVTSWATLEAVRADHEGEVPWCETCQKTALEMLYG